MNNMWSSRIQGIGTLYLSRSLRFSDRFKEDFTKRLGDLNGNVLEIGCGPGALCASIKRWYPKATVSGLDRDSDFIRFAAESIPNVKFVKGDACALPFSDGSLDFTLSNTVHEHVPPKEFFGEQYRVLKCGGKCIVMSCRKTFKVEAECIATASEFERSLWKKSEGKFAEAFNSNGVGAYATSEAEIPLQMERYGFTDVETHYVTVSLTPDDPSVPKDLAHGMINSERQNDLDGADHMLTLASDVVTEDEIASLKEEINRKYDERIRLYDNGIHMWDSSTSVIMIVIGTKPNKA